MKGVAESWEDKQVVINFIAIIQGNVEAGRLGLPDFQGNGNGIGRCGGSHVVAATKFVQGQGDCRGGVYGDVDETRGDGNSVSGAAVVIYRMSVIASGKMRLEVACAPVVSCVNGVG